MSEEPDAGIEVDPGHRDSDVPTGRRTSRPRTRLAVTAALVVLLLAAIAFAAVGYHQHRSDDAAQSDRNAAVNVAEQFTLRLDTYSYKDLAGYAKRVTALLTDKTKADFKSSFKGFESAFKTIQIVSKGTVLSVGVEDIDQDSATVLVIHDVHVTSKGCVQPPYKRMSVDLRKVKGKWLVDDFKEGVPGCQG